MFYLKLWVFSKITLHKSYIKFTLSYLIEFDVAVKYGGE